DDVDVLGAGGIVGVDGGVGVGDGRVDVGGGVAAVHEEDGVLAGDPLALAGEGADVGAQAGAAAVDGEVGAARQLGEAGVEGGAGGAHVVDQERVDDDALAGAELGAVGDLGNVDAGRGRHVRRLGDDAEGRQVAADGAVEAVVGRDAGVAGG